MIDLDPILSAAKPGSQILLQPGIYSTAGRPPGVAGPCVPVGCQLIGTPGKTTIRLRSPQTWASDLMVVSTADADDGNVLIQGITVECGPPAPGFKCNGISAIGSGNSIQNCTVLGAFGSAAMNDGGREGFGIAIFDGPTKPNINGSIVGCTVTGSVNYVTNFKIGGGLVDSNISYGPCWNGLGFTNSTGATFSNNLVIGATNGIYTDTGINAAVNVVNNTFVDIRRGACIRGQVVSGNTKAVGINGFLLDGNTFLMRNSGPEVAALELDNSPQGTVTQADNIHYMKSVTFQNNFVGIAGPGAQVTFSTHARMAANLAGSDAPAGFGISKVLFNNNTFSDAPGDGWTWRNMGGKATLVKVVREVNPGWIQT